MPWPNVTEDDCDIFTLYLDLNYKIYFSLHLFSSILLRLFTTRSEFCLSQHILYNIKLHYIRIRIATPRQIWYATSSYVKSSETRKRVKLVISPLWISLDTNQPHARHERKILIFWWIYKNAIWYECPVSLHTMNNIYLTVLVVRYCVKPNTMRNYVSITN